MGPFTYPLTTYLLVRTCLLTHSLTHCLAYLPVTKLQTGPLQRGRGSAPAPSQRAGPPATNKEPVGSGEVALKTAGRALWVASPLFAPCWQMFGRCLHAPARAWPAWSTSARSTSHRYRLVTGCGCAMGPAYSRSCTTQRAPETSLRWEAPSGLLQRHCAPGCARMRRT